MRVGDYATYCANLRGDNRRPCKQQACSMTFSNLPATLFELGYEAVQYVMFSSYSKKRHWREKKLPKKRPFCSYRQ